MLHPNFQQRLNRARNEMAKRGLEALLIFSPENLRYLTGFSGEASFGVLSGQGIYLITDYRFVEQAQTECLGTTVICRDRDRQTLGNVFAEILSSERTSNIGIESEHLSHDSWLSVETALVKFNLLPSTGLIEHLRMCKDEWEIAQIKEAAAIADAALQALLSQLELGVTEKHMAHELDYLVRSHGADDVAFPTILGFGSNSARPHCVPSQRPLMSGDIVLIDFGAVVNGYRSDMTRTFVAGRPTAQQSMMMATVLRAQEAAIAAVRPGIAGFEVDEQAERVFASSPFKPHAGKGLGHGIGLKLHELPFLGQKCGEILKAGFVVTIEPGLYIPQYGGVRYEDDILIEESGAKVLTKSPKFFELDI